MYKVSGWEFNEKVSEVFDEHVNQSVPLYTEIQNVVASLSDFFINSEYPIYDLGCSTGETISKINMRHYDKDLRFIGIDESASMLNKAKEKTHLVKNVTFINSKIENFVFKERANLIIAILTLQFLPIEARKKVISNIYNALNEGGALLLVEKTYPANVQCNDIFTQIYHDFKEKRGLTASEIREKDKSLRSKLTPLPLDKNIKILREQGFETDVFFKYLNFAGIICLK